MVTGKPWKCGLLSWAVPDKEGERLVRPKGRMEDERRPALPQLRLGEFVSSSLPAYAGSLNSVLVWGFQGTPS